MSISRDIRIELESVWLVEFKNIFLFTYKILGKNMSCPFMKTVHIDRLQPKNKLFLVQNVGEGDISGHYHEKQLI